MARAIRIRQVRSAPRRALRSICLRSPGRVPNADSDTTDPVEDEDDGNPARRDLMTAVLHPSVDERSARGRAAREQVPRSVHTGWAPSPDRPDPVALLEEQNTTREPDLVPIRHGRMLISPFTFYRGAAKIMATDLKDTPTAGLRRTTVRRCAPLELRCVRISRANTAVRSERLRRDAPRTVRVRREADGRELHDRGAQQRLQSIRCPCRDAARRSRRIAQRWPSSPRCAPWTSGTHACRSKSS